MEITQEAKSNQIFNLMKNPFKRDKYQFLGWSVNPNAKVAEYKDGQQVLFSKSMKLYAVWQQSLYTIIWDGQGGYVERNYDDGNDGQYIETLPNATWSGRTFLGWYTNTSYIQQISAPVIVNGNATYYAKWKEHQYYVEYSTDDSTTPAHSVNRQGPYNYTTTLRMAEAPGNWGRLFTVTFNPNGANAQVIGNSQMTVPCECIGWNAQKNQKDALYAVGEDVSKLNVTDNGTTILYPVWKCKSGSELTLPSASFSGHEFLGWYTDNTSGTYVGKNGNSYSPPEDNITLYAHWKDSSISAEYLADESGNDLWTEDGNQIEVE